MDITCKGRCIPMGLIAGALIVGLVACAQPSKANQEKSMQDAMAADIQREQDNAVAIVDAAIPRETGPVISWAGYPPMKPGAAQTPQSLIDQVHKLADSLRSYADSDPQRVEEVLGTALSPDSEGRRRGVTGKVGAGTYEWAVWKFSPDGGGQAIELTVAPAEACLDFQLLKSPLVDNGFRMHVPAFGDDQRITFYKSVSPSLTLYVSIKVDVRDAPTCASVVNLEVAPSDA
ncbi:hypothetical protein [Stenotrophomonas nematodicola]|jgi:hypothetical protein|uniref:Lipoprotein n=1 Tax=Stenotrophomonas nematodicola TaxID=2656746 RepID=A0ABW7CT63_9GAMM